MKLLYLTHCRIGDRSFGGAIRASSLRDALVAHGSVDTLMIHGGTAFRMDEEADDHGVKQATFTAYGMGREALRQRREVKKWVKRVIDRKSYDFIVAQYLDLAELVPREAQDRLIFDADDFQKTVSGHGLGAFKIRLRNWLAWQMAKRSRHVWYASPAPDQLPPNRERSLLPNTVPFPKADRVRAAVIPGRILMVGQLVHQPNADGLRWFHNEVLPTLKERFGTVELHVIGRHDGNLPQTLPNAVFHGFVDDLAAEYDRATLVIAPITTGAGTQIKVLDALAHGRPVLCSAFSHRGFADDFKPGEHLRVAQTAEEWIAQYSDLHNTPADAEAMAERGERAVRQRFGQERISAAVTDTLTRLAKTPNA